MVSTGFAVPSLSCMAALMAIILQGLHTSHAQMLRGWYMSPSGPVCSISYDGGTVDPAVTTYPPDSLFLTWTLGDDRGAPLVKASKDMQAKMNAGITAGKFDDSLAALFAPTFVQHSPFKADGPDGAISHYKSAAYGAGYDSQPVIEIYDGPFTATLSKRKFADKPDTMAVMDVWLSAGGKFYEHWDLMRASPGPNPSGRTLFDAVTTGEATTPEQRNRNKELVVNAINDYRNLKWPNSVDQYFADNYMVHSVGGVDGKASLKDSINKPAPDTRWDIKIVAADKDLVFALSKVTLTNNNGVIDTYSVGEVYRVKDCKLVEYWALTEKVPPPAMFKNVNGPF